MTKRKISEFKLYCVRINFNENKNTSFRLSLVFASIFPKAGAAPSSSKMQFSFLIEKKRSCRWRWWRIIENNNSFNPIIIIIFSCISLFFSHFNLNYHEYIYLHLAMINATFSHSSLRNNRMRKKNSIITTNNNIHYDACKWFCLLYFTRTWLLGCSYEENDSRCLSGSD